MSRSRNFCFTLNNYTDEQFDRICAIQCRYLVIGKEIGESGTPHLQGYICFKEARSAKAVRKDLPGAHTEVQHGTCLQASDYCKKDDKNFFEKGDLPVSAEDKGRAEVQRWGDALAAVSEGRLSDVPADIICRHLKSIEYAVDRIATSKRKLETLEGEMVNQWFVGPPGCGKSKRARDENPGAYIKDPQERWWDGYAGEDVVIIDDFDKFQVKQGGDMKRWSDRYPFRAPVKGGYMMMRPSKVIVTSNYRPDEIWDDQATVTAISRRFTLVEWPRDVVPLYAPCFKSTLPPPFPEG